MTHQLPILAIDPGPEKSGWAWLGSDHTEGGIDWNCDVERMLIEGRGRFHLAIEWVESFGMPVGKDVFETVRQIGRFECVWGGNWMRVPRKDVKRHICGSMKAKDANIRQALLDMYPATGGGKIPQIGTKQKPGPLYGFRTHMWAALAVAVTAQHKLREHTYS